MFRIALIADIHLKIGEKINDVDTQSNLHNVLAQIKRWKVDHIIIAGDLSAKEPYIGDCHYVAKEIGKLAIPFSIIRGNHDESDHISKAFELTHYYNKNSQELYYEKSIGERPFLFLDTKRGTISSEQMDWLKDKLDKSEEINPVIIMHYPPVKVSVPYMDRNHSFDDSAKFLNLLEAYKQPINIFCGHAHVEKSIQFRNLNIFITPSLLTQIDQQSETFKVDHKHIAFRSIEIEGDNLWTSVHYLF